MSRTARPVPFSLMPEDDRRLADVMAHLGIKSRSQYLRQCISRDHAAMQREKIRAARKAAATLEKTEP